MFSRVHRTAFLAKEFQKFDIDRDGGLTIFEFSLIANSLGRDMYPIQLQLAFQLCDIDKNGQIDFEELCTWWLSEVRAPERNEIGFDWFGRRRRQQLDIVQERELAMRAFAQFDTDGNGSLDADEFKLLTRLTGATLSQQDITSIMNQIDTDGNHVRH